MHWYMLVDITLINKENCKIELKKHVYVRYYSEKISPVDILSNSHWLLDLLHKIINPFAFNLAKLACGSTLKSSRPSSK